MNQTHLNNFILYLEEIKGLSEKTRGNYRLIINEFIRFLDVKETGQVDVSDIYSYLSYLHENNNAASSKCAKLTVVKQFYKYLKKIKAVGINVFEDFDMPKTPKKNS